MTASSARVYSASEASIFLAAQDLHLWFCRGETPGLADTFLRATLSRYAPVAPGDWQLTRGPHGKPELVDPPGPLAFNLSRSGEWLACAVTAGTAVGIDLEYCDPQRDVLKLARRFFRADEVASLEACAGLERTRLFYDYWTLKEARVKSTGGSLARELEISAFKLEFPQGAAGVGAIVADSSNTGASECYWLLDPIPDYRTALCCRCPAEHRPRLRLFELLASGNARTFSRPLRAVGGTASNTVRTE